MNLLDSALPSKEIGLVGLIVGVFRRIKGIKPKTPETNTGGLVEYTKGLDITLSKELGKIAS